MDVALKSKKIEADIEKALTDFVREKINDNSFDVDFKLGFWATAEITTANGETFQEIAVPGHPYKTKRKNYVPIAIEGYDGNILNIKGIFNIDYTLPLTFQIMLDEDDETTYTFFDDVINAINEFKNNLRGMVWKLEVETENGTQSFNMVTGTDNLTPTDDIEIMAGKKYVRGSINLHFDISKDILYGNMVHMYMSEFDENIGGLSTDPERVYPLAPSFSRENEPESWQNFNTRESQHSFKTTSFDHGAIIFVEDKDLHWTLMQDVTEKEELNKRYVLSLIFHRFNDEGKLEPKFYHQDVVGIGTGDLSYSIGEPISLEFAMLKMMTEHEKPYKYKLSVPEYIAEKTVTGADYIELALKNNNNIKISVNLWIDGDFHDTISIEPKETEKALFDELAEEQYYRIEYIAKPYDPYKEMLYIQSDKTEGLFLIGIYETETSVTTKAKVLASGFKYKTAEEQKEISTFAKVSTSGYKIDGHTSSIGTTSKVNAIGHKIDGHTSSIGTTSKVNAIGHKIDEGYTNINIYATANAVGEKI